MYPQKKKVLFILPELPGPGGMELENLGFINAVQLQPNLEASVLNFYANPVFFRNLGFKPLKLSFFDLSSLFFSIRFLKIYLKSGLKLDPSLANLACNFPEALEGFLEKAVRSCSLCFVGTRPGKLPHLIHDLAVKHQKPIAYHEISKFNPKHQAFFEKVDAYGTFLISGIEKKEDLLKLFPQANMLEIRQWLYDGQDDFLKIPSPNPDRLVFGTVSRLDYGKNFEVVFEALAILKRQGHILKFLLFGDGPELPKLKQLATTLDIESFVDFRGPVKFENRTSVYATLDVFVMSSIIEGGPVTILESMAAGRPAISTNVGDVRNRIENGFNGFILESLTDPAELAEKMTVYLNQPDLVLRHGANSRSKFMKEFDQIKGKETFLKTISNLIPN